MKVLGNLLVLIGLVLGALSAATAYLVPLDADDDALIGLELGAPAGVTSETVDPESLATRRAELRVKYEAGEMSASDFVSESEAMSAKIEPEPGKTLTAEDVEDLRVAGVLHVRKKTFAGLQWPHWWLFLLSAIGLGIGSLTLRSVQKREVQADAPGASSGPSARDSLNSILEIVRDVRDEVAKRDEHDGLKVIVDRIGSLQQNEIAAFVNARSEMIGRLGLGGYAELMDRFAAAERQLNRAWSAAADGVYEEAVDCLDLAPGMLLDVETKLAPLASA